MEYTIKAHPTMYNGVQYRSRLEARWAAFFDLAGWVHEYEPVDLNGWSPDFLIRGNDGGIYVEVKPVVQLPIDVAEKIDRALPSPKTNEEHDAFPGEPLIIGRSPLPSEYGMCIGWLRQGAWAESPFTWFDRLGFCHAENSFTDRITGVYDGNFGNVGIAEEFVDCIWKQAGNVVQYKPQGDEAVIRGGYKRDAQMTALLSFDLMLMGSTYYQRAIDAGISDVYEDRVAEVRDLAAKVDDGEATLNDLLIAKASLISMHRSIDKFEQRSSQNAANQNR